MSRLVGSPTPYDDPGTDSTSGGVSLETDVAFRPGDVGEVVTYSVRVENDTGTRQEVLLDLEGQPAAHSRV